MGIRPEHERAHRGSSATARATAAGARSPAEHAVLAMQRAAGNRAVTMMMESRAAARPTPPTRAALALVADTPPGGEAAERATAASGLSAGPDLHVVDGHTDTPAAAPVPVHDSAQSHRAAAALGTHAYTYRGEIALGAGLDDTDGPGRAAVLAHELAHIRQTAGGPAAASGRDEAEAAVQEGREGVRADPDRPHGLFWLIPVAVGAYILLRPNVANAPTPDDVRRGNVQPSVSSLQVAGEAVALFAVPGGVASGLARVGYGVIAASAVGGAASAVSFRGVQDVGAGEFSGPQAYIVDATTGAVIGAVVGGAVRIFGGPGTLGSPGANPGLVHFTTTEAQQAILATSESGQAIGQLRGRVGIWALSDDALQQAPWQRAARATMSLNTAQAPVPIPPAAAGQFSRAVPVGPVSGWQYAMGVYRAPAGSISMATGEFAASGGIMTNIKGLIFPYGADAAIWISAASAGMSLGQSGTADERGIRTLLPRLPASLRPAIEGNLPMGETTRSDGPFVVLPGLGADAAIAGAQGSYDPVAEVCYGPESNQSSPAEDAGPPPAVIYVAPFWPVR